jgi:transposase-like protein
MSQKRRTFSKEFKAKVALEAVQGVKTLQQIASQHQVHPNQVSAWRKQLLDGAASLFERGEGGTDGADAAGEAQTAPLYQKIGRLEMENDFLRKKL